MSDIKKMRPLAILKKYFGQHDEYKGDSGLRGFSRECKELAEADKNELVELAAKELGVEIDRD